MARSTGSSRNMRRRSSNSLAVLLARDSDEDEEEGLTDDEPVIAGRTAPPAAGGGEAEFERALSRGLAKTKQLMRTVSHSMRRMSKKNDLNLTGIGVTTAGPAGDGPDVSSGCLRLNGRGTGCKVGACEEFESLGGGGGVCGSRRKSGPGTDKCLPHHHQSTMPRIETALLQRFSHGVSDIFRKKTSFKKDKKSMLPQSPPPAVPALRAHAPDQQHPRQAQFGLPDDVLATCLVRLPLSSLMTARLVCRRWRALSSTPHFMQMRVQGPYRTPWLFLFGIIKDGCPGGEIHALDVTADRWHKIRAGFLRGRYLFSVASVGTDLYVVGGCSRLHRMGVRDGNSSSASASASASSKKTHRSVVVFNPLSGSWSKATSMKWSRSGAVLGVVDVSPSFPAFNSQQQLGDYQDRRRRWHVPRSRSRIGGVSDVYEDPHRCSLRRRQWRDASATSDSDEESPENDRRSGRATTSVSPPPVLKLEEKKYEDDKERHAGLIAVGGIGPWDEPLDTAEIYNPTTNRWFPIANLPADFGAACSGAACNGVFYVYSDADKLAGYSLEFGTWTRIDISALLPPRLQEYPPKLVSGNGSQLFMVAVSWCERSRLQRSAKAIRKMWELSSSPFSPSSSTPLSWIEVSRHPDAPMDFNAAFTGQGDRVYGVEMFRVFGQLLGFVTACDVSGPGRYRWSRVSRNRSVRGADAASCKGKAVAVLQL